MKTFKFVLLFAMTVMPVSFAEAHQAGAKCRVVLDQQDNTQRIEYTDGSLPTVREVLRATMASGEDFRNLVNSMNVTVLDDAQNFIPMPINSIPTQGKNDPRCKNKQVTGLDCRGNQLIESGVSEGLESEYYIIADQPTESSGEKLNQIVDQLGCRYGSEDAAASGGNGDGGRGNARGANVVR
jgi:hypothetical protein